MNKPTKQLIGIKYEILPLKILKSTEGYPQKMTDQEMKGLVKSMKEKGWILDAPVCWKRPDGEFQIISGHHRIEAGIQAGIVETGCKVVEGITEEQARIFVIEANQRRGRLDSENLDDFLKQISADYNFTFDEIFEEVGIYDEFERNKISFEGLDEYVKKPDSEIFKKFDNKSDQVNKNKNWFYVEYYEDDELFDALKSIVKFKSKNSEHELDSEYFKEVIFDYAKK